MYSIMEIKAVGPVGPGREAPKTNGEEAVTESGLNANVKVSTRNYVPSAGMPWQHKQNG